MHFRATVFRFTDPKHSKGADVVSGIGGLRASGRWNLEGAFRLSYTSTTPETALAETLAHARYYLLPGDEFLPKLLVSLNADLKNTLDLTNGSIRTRL